MRLHILELNYTAYIIRGKCSTSHSPARLLRGPVAREPPPQAAVYQNEAGRRAGLALGLAGPGERGGEMHSCTTQGYGTAATRPGRSLGAAHSWSSSRAEPPTQCPHSAHTVPTPCRHARWWECILITMHSASRE